MKYLIDLAMLYEVDSGVIMINGEEESSIKLSNQAARLLYELIINNGKTLDRDDLIKKVWEDRGFSGSSVSLNVAISEIRKAFRSLGRDPLLIKTIRGKGFSLAAHIEHHTVRPPVSAPEKIVAEAPDVVTQQRDPPARLRRRDSGFTTLCVMALVVIAGIAALFSIKICAWQSARKSLISICWAKSIAVRFILSIRTCISRNRLTLAGPKRPLSVNK